MRLSSQTTEYVHTQVAIDDTPAPASIGVEFAFLPSCAWPAAGTPWQPGEWVSGHPGRARVLIGPGGHPLAVGAHSVWVRITDNPEVPVLAAGLLTIT